MGAPEALIAVLIICWVVLCNVLTYIYNVRNIFTRRSCAWSRSLCISNETYETEAQPPLAPERQPAKGPPRREHDYWAFDLIDPTDVVTGPLGTSAVLLLRVFMVVFFIFTMIWQEVGPAKLSSGYGEGATWLTFWTDWTFLLFGLVSLLGAILSFQACLLQRKGALVPRLGQWTGFEKFHLLLLETVCTCELTLTVVYWAALSDGTSNGNIDNLFRHGINLIPLFLSILISRTPIVSYHFQAALVYGSVYALFFWLYYAGSEVWVYGLLGWDKTSALGAWVALVVVILLCFCFTYLLAWLRECVVRRQCLCVCFPRTLVRPQVDAAVRVQMSGGQPHANGAANGDAAGPVVINMAAPTQAEANRMGDVAQHNRAVQQALDMCQHNGEHHPTSAAAGSPPTA